MDVQRRLEVLAREFAGLTPRHIVRKFDDGGFDVRGDDGKYARLSDDGADLRIEFLVDRTPPDRGVTVSEAVAATLTIRGHSDGDVLMIVCDYLRNPQLPAKL